MPTKPPEGPPAPEKKVLGTEDQNPKDIGLLSLIGEDLRTHGGRVSAPGFWALAVHRFGNWRMSVRTKPLRAPLSLAYFTAFHSVRLLWNIDISYVVKVGRRVRIDHHGAVMVGAESIGNDVVFRHSVVVGVMHRGDATVDKPKIEDRVELGPRACVVGKVTVGHDTLVCANTVVPVNIPPKSVVLGVPGRLVNLSRHLDSVSN